ncbi:MAG: MaoC family dehydratase N-terminal domain-containing protein [Dehalococcoidia bacterium]|nr:MaoC family dehydratase N-terminal domain-containing protein [Dehalococcoidia bacterium]
MAADSGVMAELRQFIGTVTAPGLNEVERGAIRRYAEAVEDPNRLYSDFEYAAGSRFGGLIAPPGFFGWPLKVSTAAMEVMAPVFETVLKAGLFRILDAGVEYDFFLPVRADDILTWYARFADASEREGKAGRMVFLTMELVYLNQNGDTVARRRQTFLAR